MNANSMKWLLIFKALRLKWRRTLVIVAALTIGAAMVTAMASVYFDINEKMSRELRSFGANFYLGGKNEQPFTLTEYRRITAAMPPTLYHASSPYLYTVARSEREPVALVGVDFPALPALVPYWQVQGGWIGVDFDDRNTMLGKTLARQLELNLGDDITLVKDNGERKTFRIKGIIESGDAMDNVMLLNIGVVQAWTDNHDRISYALASLANDNDAVTAYAERLSAENPQLDIHPIRKVSAAEGQILHKIKGLMGLVCIIILLLSSLCVNTSLTAMTHERRREFALQSALGASDRQITAQIVRETLTMTTLAIAIGLILGLILAQILGHVVFHAGITLRWPVLPLAAVLSLTVAAVAVALPLKRVLALQAAVVLKGA